MPSKKRKYEARFPPARIKKIMQTDEEIGKVAAAVPIIISRSLEIFLQSLVETTARYTNERKAKTMTTAHLKHNIENEKKFDFLKDLVANVADVATQDEEDTCGEVPDKPKKQRKPRASVSERKKRKKGSSSDGDESDARSDDVDEKPSQSKRNKRTPSTLVQDISESSSSSSSSIQPISHSIDHIMGNTNKPISSSPSFNQPPITSSASTAMVLPSSNSVSTNEQSNTAAVSAPTTCTESMPSSVSMSMISTNDDEDDDYDI